MTKNEDNFTERIILYILLFIACFIVIVVLFQKTNDPLITNNLLEGYSTKTFSIIDGTIEGDGFICNEYSKDKIAINLFEDIKSIKGFWRWSSPPTVYIDNEPILVRQNDPGPSWGNRIVMERHEVYKQLTPLPCFWIPTQSLFNSNKIEKKVRIFVKAKIVFPTGISILVDQPQDRSQTIDLNIVSSKKYAELKLEKKSSDKYKAYLNLKMFSLYPFLFCIVFLLLWNASFSDKNSISKFLPVMNVKDIESSAITIWFLLIYILLIIIFLFNELLFFIS